MNRKIKIEPFIERLNNTDFKQGTKFKFLDKIYLYDFPNLVGVYEIGKPTKPEYSIFAQLDMTNLHCEVEILEDNTEEIEELNAYKLMETPYMANLLKEQRYDEFMEHLKQSEVEIADKLMKLIWAIKEIRKERE